MLCGGTNGIARLLRTGSAALLWLHHGTFGNTIDHFAGGASSSSLSSESRMRLCLRTVASELRLTTPPTPFEESVVIFFFLTTAGGGTNGDSSDFSMRISTAP